MATIPEEFDSAAGGLDEFPLDVFMLEFVAASGGLGAGGLDEFPLDVCMLEFVAAAGGLEVFVLEEFMPGVEEFRAPVVVPFLRLAVERGRVVVERGRVVVVDLRVERGWAAGFPDLSLPRPGCSV